MFNRFRRTAAASVAVLALGAGGAAWAASSASAAAGPAAVARCTYNNLAVWVYADGADTTAGTVTYPLEFTNLGRATCFLDGFPRVAASTLGRVQLGANAADLNGVPAKVIDIAPGATAHSTIQYLGGRVVASCKPERAGFLTVYPPNSGAAKRAFFPLPVCTTGRVDLTVRRVAAGF
jgi:Protein of unknown function (DUF4232)